MPEPAVSVIVASFNARATIGAALDSLQRQDGDVPFEVIVVDSSQDGTGIFFPDGKAFVAALRPHKTLNVRHQRMGAKRALPATFKLTGLETALVPFLKGCPLD